MYGSSHFIFYINIATLYTPEECLLSEFMTWYIVYYTYKKIVLAYCIINSVLRISHSNIIIL